jgi:hypothetical protein
MSDNPETDSTVESPVKNDTEKLFSQEDLNKLVSERVKREQANSRKDKEDFDNKLKSLSETLSGYEEALNKLLEEVENELDPSVKKLLDKLSPLERLEWLGERKGDKGGKKPIPQTEKPNTGEGTPDTKKYPRVL